MSRGLALFAAAALSLHAGAVLAKKKNGGGAKGILEVSATVKGADIIIDGKKQAKTPSGPLSITVGVRTVVVKKLGYLDYTEKVKIGAGDTTRVVADLLPFAGVISVTANAPKAKVQVDGKTVGTAPLEIEVSLGQRQITVSAPGWKSFSTSIRADAGTMYPIEAKLTRGSGPASDDLDLAPLEPLEPLALEPVAVAPPPGKKPAPAAAADDDLDLAPLEPLEPPPAKTTTITAAPVGDAGGDDDLELEALPDLEAPPPAPKATVAATDPDFGDPMVGGTLEPPTPWYLEWYSLAGAAAVVVTGVTVTAVLLSGGEEEEPMTPWKPGVNDDPDAVVR
jgi:hypothetical protein